MVEVYYVPGGYVPSYTGHDLFPCTADIHGIVSTHVETVVLMTRTDAGGAQKTACFRRLPWYE